MTHTEDALLADAARQAFGPKLPDRIGVAVSGGSDSMATLHLMAETGAQVFAMTVDHGLRPEAASEAALVAEACARIGVPHNTLNWRRTGTGGNLQDQARRARYGLISEWARGQGITHVVLGHTANDEAETFLMNLSRSAGIDGLSGMRRRWTSDGVSWARPFLGSDRAELRGWLERRGIAWVEDPSNSDMQFQRVKARNALAALAPLGIDASRLAVVARNLNSARSALIAQAVDFADHHVRTDGGDVVIARPAWQTAEPEVARRVLTTALRWVSGAEYAPRESALVAARAAIEAQKSHTLSGCRILCAPAAFRIAREGRAVRDLRAAPGEVWDDRWVLQGPDAEVTVAALGGQGLRHCPDWRATGRPRGALLATPAVWRDEALIAAPFAGFAQRWTATLIPERADFLAMLQSH